MNALTQPGQAVPRPAKAHAANLETIIAAAAANRLILIECKLVSTGEVIAVLATVGGPDPDGQAVITPFAAMFNGNPFEMLQPPNPDGGFFTEEPL